MHVWTLSGEWADPPAPPRWRDPYADHVYLVGTFVCDCGTTRTVMRHNLAGLRHRPQP